MLRVSFHGNASSVAAGTLARPPAQLPTWYAPPVATCGDTIMCLVAYICTFALRQ